MSNEDIQGVPLDKDTFIKITEEELEKVALEIDAHDREQGFTIGGAALCPLVPQL